MAKLKILVVEDDHFLAEELVEDLKEMGYNPLPYQTESSGAFAVIKSEVPDIILMDIELDGSIDGIDLARIINAKYNIPIIYMTATDDKYLKDAVDTEHYDFLSKPFTKSQVKISIERAILMQIEQVSRQDISDRIFVKQDESYIVILVDNIQYIEAQEWESLVTTADGDKLVKVSFSNLEKQIRNTKLIRVQRSFMINPESVDEIAVNGTTVKIGGKYIKVSKKFIPNLGELFKIIKTKF
jgi:DNA-binding LytR/AlgR family response regulator